MEDKNKQSDSTLNKSASAANALRGAAKTGKTVSKAAKGAAAGGPYGAIAGGLWENRKLLAKIIAAATFVMMLPILFILMLPALIFGKLGIDKAPDNVMNDNSIIMENISDTETVIEDILRERHDKLLEEIQNEADKLSSDCTYSITDEFADRITFESTLIISQFSASRDDYEEINIDKLKELLNENIDDIFSYRTETTKEASDETAGTITHYEYIVEYAGDSYYADHVFKLNDEQKSLALGYAENLNIFLNDSIDIAENPDIKPGETGNAVVDLALTKLGTPYSQEKRNMDGYFDCSSFSYWVYSHFDIYLSYNGANTAASQARYIKERNLVAAYENLAPGDLIFYSYGVNNRYLNIDHVAIYCGDGYLVEASGSDMKVVYRPVYGVDHIVLCGRPYAE